jgi:hypothetical protein
LDLACLLRSLFFLFCAFFFWLGSSHFSLCHQYMIPPLSASIGFSFALQAGFAGVW